MVTETETELQHSNYGKTRALFAAVLYTRKITKQL